MTEQEKQAIDEGIEGERKRANFLTWFPTALLYKPVIYAIATRASYKHINPNQLTLCMLWSVLLALPCFFCPSPYALLVAWFFLQFFEIFDDADGAVARVTHQLSPFGEQLDFLMHLICHPLMSVAIGYSVYFSVPGETIWSYPKLWVIVLVYGSLIITELTVRTLDALAGITKLKQPSSGVPAPLPTGFKGFLRCAYAQASCFVSAFPVYLLIVPIFLFVDRLTGTPIAFYYTLVLIAFTALRNAKVILGWLIKFSKAHV
jgi:phosphatidylglycerophosphate synthase